MSHTLVPIVEGHGEVQAVRVLLERLLETLGRYDLLGSVHRPQRKKRHKIVKEGELEKEVERAARIPGCQAILIILDADDDCPAVIGPELRKRALATRSDLHIEVCIAKRTYEAWFIGGASELAGKCGMLDELDPPDDPEGIPSPKGWIKNRMKNKCYQETIDQVRLTTQFDITEASKRSPSFSYFCKVVKRIADAL